MKWLAALALALLCGGAIAQADNPYDSGYKPREAGIDVPGREEKDWKEGELKLPPYPSAENLVEFEVRGAGSFRFFVDATSISIGEDEVVRYISVARSRNGVESVSYDGLRCSTVSHRLYATGLAAERRWSIVQAGAWKKLSLGASGRQHLVLMRDFFCPAGFTIGSPKEGVAALRQGGHPDAVSNHSDFRH